MENLLNYALEVFMSFFAIMNPIANTPIFLGLVEGETKENKKKIARTGTITAFIIVVCFAIAGKYIFELFENKKYYNLCSSNSLKYSKLFTSKNANSLVKSYLKTFNK